MDFGWSRFNHQSMEETSWRSSSGYSEHYTAGPWFIIQGHLKQIILKMKCNISESTLVHFNQFFCSLFPIQIPSTSTFPFSSTIPVLHPKTTHFILSYPSNYSPSPHTLWLLSCHFLPSFPKVLIPVSPIHPYTS